MRSLVRYERTLLKVSLHNKEWDELISIYPSGTPVSGKDVRLTQLSHLNWV